MSASEDDLLFGNHLLSDFLVSEKTFSIGRVGSVESNILQAVDSKSMTTRLRKQAWLNAGLSYPTNNQLRFFCSVYRQSISDLDILAVWPEEALASQTLLIETSLKDNAGVVPLRCLDPVQLVAEGVKPEAIWTNKLAGKNVLVVHSFAELIDFQYAKLDGLHRSRILPSFNLFVLEPPETNGLTFWRGTYRKNLFDFMQKLSEFVDTNKIEIVLLAAGAYGLPLVKHLRDTQTSAIYMGGSLQLLFGIMGTRWVNIPSVQSARTDSWINGSLGKKPLGHKLIEGATYW